MFASLLFCFATACPSTGDAQGGCHPPPEDCVQGLVFYDACFLGWGMETTCSTDGLLKPRGVRVAAPAPHCPLSQNVCSPLDLPREGCFNSETPLVPPGSQGSSGQAPHLGHWAHWSAWEIFRNTGSREAAQGPHYGAYSHGRT